jgi:hypothetical protein
MTTITVFNVVCWLVTVAALCLSAVLFVDHDARIRFAVEWLARSIARREARVKYQQVKKATVTAIEYVTRQTDAIQGEEGEMNKCPPR